MLSVSTKRSLGHIRRVAATLGVAGVISGAALFGASAATAQTPQGPTVTAQGTAPACIERVVNAKAKQALAGNHCGKTMKVKIIVNNDYDSACTTLRHGQYFIHSWSWGSYARTVTC